MKQLRKDEAMHHYYGFDQECRQCCQCEHFIGGVYHNRRYYKCTVYGCSHSEATDWRRGYTACGLIGKPFPEGDIRIVDLLKAIRIKKEEQIEGQTKMMF